MHYALGSESTSTSHTRNPDWAYDAEELAAVHERFSRLDRRRTPGARQLGRHIWNPALDERFTHGLAVVLDGFALRARAAIGQRCYNVVGTRR